MSKESKQRVSGLFFARIGVPNRSEREYHVDDVHNPHHNNGPINKTLILYLQKKGKNV